MAKRMSASGDGQLVKAITGKTLSASHTESCAIGSYLEAWFHCLKLSKEYTQNSRTGFFPSDKAYQTFRLFGRVEDCTFIEWWHEWGFEKFCGGLTSIRIRLVVSHQTEMGYGFTLDVYPETSLNLASCEFEFWIDQVRKLNKSGGLLSDAPMAWTIYKSRISFESIRLHLEVLNAYEQIIRGDPSTKLWRIGEQLHLNPKAMTRKSDSPKEQVEKHIVMGQTVSSFVKKGQGLVRNACDGMFPRFNA